MPKWRMKGEYIKNCNCLASCPCDTIGVPAPHANCEGMAGMRILEGSFDGVDLSGLKWVATVHWPGALHEGNGTMEAFLDANASEAQRNALVQILTGQAGGGLFEVLAAVCPNVVGPHFVPIEWEFDREKRRARVAVAGYMETVSKPLTIPPTGEEQRVVVQMPNGFEYKSMEVAQTAVLRSKGAVNFEWEGTHSSLAIVEHTDQGLAA
ncbi:MAG: DUF1326 domain-containing protein [Dehalococcoidia bacterium]|nr:DUF1326 domain-containing protein [Dehalococcoidia bacterium]